MPAPYPPSDDFVRKVEVHRLIDGDTIDVVVDVGFCATVRSRIRLANVNTPEMRGHERPAGEYVLREVVKWLANETKGVIHSRRFELGPFGRCICDLWIGSRNLNAWLLESGLAWETDERGDLIYDRILDTLHGIPAEIRRECRRLAG
jgi:micrococcal nuclease